MKIVCKRVCKLNYSSISKGKFQQFLCIQMLDRSATVYKICYSSGSGSNFKILPFKRNKSLIFNL